MLDPSSNKFDALRAVRRTRPVMIQVALLSALVACGGGGGGGGDEPLGQAPSPAPAPAPAPAPVGNGPFIVVDQFGYLPTLKKIAVLRDPVTGYDSADEYTPGTTKPPQKSDKDFNDGWPLNSWPITENSNGYQTAYIRLLSRYVK